MSAAGHNIGNIVLSRSLQQNEMDRDSRLAANWNDVLDIVKEEEQRGNVNAVWNIGNRYREN